MKNYATPPLPPVLSSALGIYVSVMARAMLMFTDGLLSMDCYRDIFIFVPTMFPEYQISNRIGHGTWQSRCTLNISTDLIMYSSLPRHFGVAQGCHLQLRLSKYSLNNNPHAPCHKKKVRLRSGPVISSKNYNKLVLIYIPRADHSLPVCRPIAYPRRSFGSMPYYNQQPSISS